MIKKLASLITSAITYSLLKTQALAQGDITIKPPTQGYKDLGVFIGNVLALAFGVALLVVLIFIVWGAFDWITSGGDKEAVGKARNKIVNALIGLAVLAVAFALANVAAQFLGFPNIYNIKIPGPNTPAP